MEWLAQITIIVTCMLQDGCNSHHSPASLFGFLRSFGFQTTTSHQRSMKKIQYVNQQLANYDKWVHAIQILNKYKIFNLLFHLFVPILIKCWNAYVSFSPHLFFDKRTYLLLIITQNLTTIF